MKRMALHDRWLRIALVFFLVAATALMGIGQSGADDLNAERADLSVRPAHVMPDAASTKAPVHLAGGGAMACCACDLGADCGVEPPDELALAMLMPGQGVSPASLAMRPATAPPRI